MDMDMQHPLGGIPQVVDQLNCGYDVVVGSRYAPGSRPEPRNALQGVLTRVESTITRVSLVYSLVPMGPMSGYLGVRGEMDPESDVLPDGDEPILLVLVRMPAPNIAEYPPLPVCELGGKERWFGG